MCLFISIIVPKRLHLDSVKSAAEEHGLGGHCDCGSPLGASADRDHDVDLEAERRRLRTYKRTSPSARSELGVENWLGFLRHVLEHGRGVSLGLLLHTYRGGVTTERVELARRERVPAGHLDAGFLTRLREDVVHEFVS